MIAWPPSAPPSVGERREGVEAGADECCIVWFCGSPRVVGDILREPGYEALRPGWVFARCGLGQATCGKGDVEGRLFLGSAEVIHDLLDRRS